jgi:hypothetical protein
MQRVRRQGLSFVRPWKSGSRSTKKAEALARPAAATPLMMRSGKQLIKDAARPIMRGTEYSRDQITQAMATLALAVAILAKAMAALAMAAAVRFAKAGAAVEETAAADVASAWVSAVA